jgi:glycosyltransferase involved in cell wall biosynthesis
MPASQLVEPGTENACQASARVEEIVDAGSVCSFMSQEARPIRKEPFFVSVCIGMHNAQRYILETLESIAAQTYRDFEVVIVDDGSRDRSVQIAEEFCARDPRFRLIRFEKNCGVVASRTAAIRATKYNWIAICDSDDVWLPTKLEKQIAYLEAFGGDEPLIALGTTAYYVNARGKIFGKYDVGMHSVPEFRQRRDSADVIFLLNSSTLFRKEVFFAVGGYRDDAKIAEDVDLWMRMAPLGTILAMEDTLVHYRVHGKSISDTGRVLQLQYLEYFRENARRRRDGREEISYDAFVQMLQSDRQRYRALMRDWRSQAFYRNSASALVNGHPLRGMILMLRAFLTAPEVPIRRFSNQVLRGDILKRFLSSRSVVAEVKSEPATADRTGR